MVKASKSRNNIVELGRFIYSLLVLGYHVQFSYKDDKIDPFENGALAVEYFFLLSGYFLSRSLEKLAKDDKNSFFKKYFYFMKNKVTALLNVHILSIVVVIIIIACFDSNNFLDIFLNGIPSIFLVHMIIVWKSDFEKALIIPEWYLSAMLICMLFMVPIFLLFVKIMKGIFATIILVGIIAIVVIITGLFIKWKFNENIVYDLRAWGEMCLGMFSYYLSIYVKSKIYGKCMNIFLKILEIVGYGVPVIFGIIPLNSSLQAYFMAITVVLEFCAIFITFSEKGNIIQNEKVNSIFGYLGSISLPIYLFHPVIIILIDYINNDVPRWLKYIIVFPASIILSFLYRTIADLINKKIEERKKEKEKEKEKEIEIEKENLDKDKQNDNQIIEINSSKAKKLRPDELNI
jgi:peptidoglycan/LPS O-acetylase OafA/YrhL